ncbi:MAG TPA: hypothetical protein VFD73_01875 [Gemmatimonadales bacterium]|nr:hypothetical protein [Gemmatimonadales bacterium]
MIADMMDARSQTTHYAALVARIATWLRGKTPGLPYRIISATTIPLFRAMPSTVPAANPMACGWAKEPGADERFGAWRSSMAWGGQHHANLIHIAAGLFTYVRTARFVRVSALMPLLGPETPTVPNLYR